MPSTRDASSGARPGRFSDDLRWVLANLNRTADAYGAPTITAAHLLAAIAKHPRGDAILRGRAKDVFIAVCGEELNPNATNSQIEMDQEVKVAIRSTITTWLAAPEPRPSQEIDLLDVLRTLQAMPETSAYPILERFGLTSSGGATAG